jgi:DNA-directed RNA polymerase subunit RPC12/RpoP
MLKPPRFSGGLHCPYTQCGKPFEKPIVLTDTTKIIRETYYACPHCQSKLDVSVDTSSGSITSISKTLNPVEVAPDNCKHHFGYLRLQDENAQIPDDCAVCPKVMQCFIKKSQH